MTITIVATTNSPPSFSKGDKVKFRMGESWDSGKIASERKQEPAMSWSKDRTTWDYHPTRKVWGYDVKLGPGRTAFVYEKSLKKA